MTKPIRVGLLRLVDSAPIVLAEAHGLFRDQGLDVRISIEPSWSNIVDKLAYGVLDAAVMLPPLAFAARWIARPEGSPAGADVAQPGRQYDSRQQCGGRQPDREWSH